MAQTYFDFGPALELTRTFQTSSDDDSVLPCKERQHDNDKQQLILGNLNAALRYLGAQPMDIPSPKHSSTFSRQSTSSSDSSPNGSYETAASSLFSDVGDIAERQLKEVRFSPDTKGEAYPEVKPRKAKRLSSLDADEIDRLVESDVPILDKEQRQPLQKPQSDKRPFSKHMLGAGSALTPAWVTPPPRPIVQAQTESAINSQPWFTPDAPRIKLHRSVLQPLQLLTKEKRKALLVRKLRDDFPDGPLCNLRHHAGRTVSRYGGNMSEDGIHVFIDGSNIVIGFADALKAARGLNRNAYIKRPPFDFHSLSLILERGRPVAKRVICGSLDSSDLEPEYMLQARKCDYSVSVLKRVTKARPVRDPIAHRTNTGKGYATSGPSDGSDANIPTETKEAEQAVDEMLQLNMCNSFLLTQKPSTIVLATGDAAEAEYSGGFLKYVEMALNIGWKVELVCWRKGMSYAWKHHEFLEKWKGKFRIVQLDKYCEELFAVYADNTLDSDCEDDWNE